MHNTYQPPQSFPQHQVPQSKYPQLPPISYGQVGVNSHNTAGNAVVNSAMNHGQVGVDPEIAHQKLLLKSDIQGKDETLDGSFGIVCRIWFVFMALYSMVMIYYGGSAQISSIYWYNRGYGSLLDNKMLLCLFFGIWLLVQSCMTVSNIGKKDAVKGKKIWVSMVLFSISCFTWSFLWIGGPYFNEISFFCLLIFSVIPIIINLIFTVMVKNLWVQRAELIDKLAALETSKNTA